jgi:hypothetical protein
MSTHSSLWPVNAGSLLPLRRGGHTRIRFSVIPMRLPDM